MRKCLAVICLLAESFMLMGQDADQILHDRGEVFFWFSRPDKVSMTRLTQMISIDRVNGDSIFAYANASEYKALLGEGIYPEILVPPSLLYMEDAQDVKKNSQSWNGYPSYEGYITLMTGYAADYPDICLLDTIGFSVDGRLLLALKISDSAKINQPEPQVFYSSSIHGDETTGYGLLLLLTDTLLKSYGNSPELTRLIDSLEIWINPLANPDGTYYSGNATVSGSTRYNANGVDLNRSFPDIRNNNFPDGLVRQPEIMAMIEFMSKKNFVLSANFHGGAEVMNYPWDTWKKTFNPGYDSPLDTNTHPDDSWFIDISKEFADTTHHYSVPGYFTDPYLSGFSNGGDWYIIFGGRQDFVTYYLRGREITIEISGIKTLPSSYMPAYWDYNRRSLINYLEQAMYGIQGFVTDSATGMPLRASIEVLNHDRTAANSSVWSDSLTGRFTRLIAAGSWDLVFSVAGYPNDTIRDVQVQNRSTSWLLVKMGDGKTQGINSEIPVGSEIRLWPVPAMEKIHVSFTISGDSRCLLRITDINGKEQLIQDYRGIQGINYLELQTAGLPDGNYILEINASGSKYPATLFTISRTP
jgi:hypothetical protein